MSMITIDLARPLGPVRPLHGVNLGPLDRFWMLDLSEAYRRAAVPSVRLHDAPLPVGDVVDLHCVFPDPRADPDDPDNYEFAQTDDYLAAIRATGAEVYFRIGESIEHAPTKRYVRGDRWSPQAVASVAAHIVRHYNDGWADGHQWGIDQWEFWNEPDGAWHKPAEQRKCWTGSADEFAELYRAVAPAIKAIDPSLQIGLAGFTGGFINQWLEQAPDDLDAMAGWAGVIPRLARDGVPIDFVSQHTYPDHWSVIADAAQRTRERLDTIGLAGVPQHLTEWNYNPTLTDDAGTFNFMQSRSSDDHRRYDRAVERANGVAGAAFVLGGLATLQDTHITRAHLYTGVSMPFGMFSTSGRPHRKFSGVEAFAELVQFGGERIGLSAEHEDLTGLAVRRDDAIRIGLAHLNDEPRTIDISVAGAGIEVDGGRLLTDDGWQPVPVRPGEAGFGIEVTGPTVVLLDGRVTS